MHWTPEHAQPLSQWPEQHLDVSSTTSSPAHKSDLYHSSRQRFNYAWANDDISALTASNLLKRYAEKYSGVLDSPYDRPSALNTYGDGAFGSLNGQKGEVEPWSMAHSAEGVYPLTPMHDGLPSSKGIVPPPVTPGNSLGTSPVVSTNLSDSIYPSNTCGGPATSGSLGASQEYPSGYSGAYLPSGYCSQPTSALPPPHPSTHLHSSGLLQPSHPSTALVPGYTSSGPMYNYASGSYPAQPSYGAIHPPHPSAPYLPSGIAAPTPIPPSSRPPVVPGYSYQSPLSVAPLSGESGSSLKRKAFDITGGEEDGEGRYRKYSYEQPKSPYQMSDNGECRGNGFNRSSEVPFKGGKRPSGAGVVATTVASEEPIGKFNNQAMKGLISPAYSVNEAPLRANESFEKFTPPVANGEHEGESFALRMQPKTTAFSGDNSSQSVEEQLKTMDPFILELVNDKVIDCGPPVQWTDIAGQVSVKAAIEEELVWPILRPGAYTGANQPPRTILLFGPRGVGKTLLSRCISTQLGSTLLKLSGTALVSKWKAEAEKILQTTFFISNCRQPAVILLTDVESVLEDAAILKSQLLTYLDKLATSAEQNVVVIATTTRPGNLDEATQRRFAKRFYISPPDSIARRQILHHALAQQNYCLSEREMASIVQLTESYSGSELLQLCQQAGTNKLHSLPGQLQPTSYKDFESVFCKIHPAVSQKELDLYVEWDKMYGSHN
ncbi:putative fidgetin-like protein 2 [Thamnophis elegans]|uniref:putative fidgetin-like protein 2 n=1 Tax=Thamnophis elegans TaxID=35005 RepID=UPI001377419F|nr:putative fidgetin-like protein 2 [Thamnophis elegans]XP_032066586.1 putative fidgetin-like protein 2 [Thamnophis elegans]